MLTIVAIGGSLFHEGTDNGSDDNVLREVCGRVVQVLFSLSSLSHCFFQRSILFINGDLERDRDTLQRRLPGDGDFRDRY